jgi:REP element-mobilizing transposase RayT
MTKPKLHYRRNLPHYLYPGAVHFVTFRVADGVRLSDEAKDIVFQHCLNDIRRVIMHAFVVMSTHVHVLFTPRRDDQGESFTLAEITKGLKGASARRVNRLLGRKGSLWQDESLDRVMRNQKDFEDRKFYILCNPVEAHLVRSPHDYKWLWLEMVEPISLAKAAK